MFNTYFTFARLISNLGDERLPVLQGCSFEVQEQLPPDAFHGVTKDFYRIQTQGWRVTNLVPYPLSHGIDNAHNI